MNSSNQMNEHKVFYTTQGGNRPHQSNTETTEVVEVPTEVVEVPTEPFVQKYQRHGSLEQDKIEVLYAIYGRANVRFA